MTPRRIAICTGSRAEFSLLTPVIRALTDHAAIDPLVLVAGSHLLPPALTKADVAALFPIAAEVPMQLPSITGRIADARALGRGVSGFADAFHHLAPHWVIVLGDRIEALAAALAASIGGIALTHIHGGDRAEGVADDAMRHAITKLAHLHCAATEESAQRIARMGEDPARIHTVGSPAIDTLADITPLDDAAFRDLGAPDTILLLHPVGNTDDAEDATARACLAALDNRRILWLAPNADPGRDGIERARRAARSRPSLTLRDHLPAPVYRALIARLAAGGGLIVGNSSGALIEAAALRCPAVDLGPRQHHRQRGTNTIRVDDPSPDSIRDALTRALAIDRSRISHPFGDGHASQRIADLLAATDPSGLSLLRKINAY